METKNATLRIPCTGGTKHFPIYDRNGVRVCLGDTIRAQVCVGPYGQTRVIEGIVDQAHWQYCSFCINGKSVSTTIDFELDRLVCHRVHNDFEHGHETWAEVIKKGCVDSRFKIKGT